MVMPASPRVLVVGLGAVAHVVGAAFVRAGCPVTFFSRRAEPPTRVALDVRGRSGAFGCAGEFDVVGVDEVDSRGGGFDVVVLAVPAPLPPPGDVLWRVVDANGSAVVVFTSPQRGFASDSGEVERSEGEVCRAGVVANVGFLAFAAPLPGEPSTSTPHTAVFFPPLAPSTLGGRGASDVVALLRRGGLPAVVDDDAAAHGAFLVALVVPITLTLRRAGYSLWTLSTRHRRACAAAVDAATRVVARRLQRPRPLSARLLSSSLFVGVVFAGAAVVDAVGLLPFPLQTYVRVHFEKTLLQSQQLLAQFVDDSADLSAGVDVKALQELA